MPKFKVGDRVKIVGPGSAGRKDRIGTITDITKHWDGIEGWDWILRNKDGKDGDIYPESSLEHAPRFAVGDAVRVKADVWDIGAKVSSQTKAKKHKIKYAGDVTNRKQFGIRLDEESYSWDGDWLEPWNDAEEWNGTAWVKKEVAKPAVVIKRENGMLDPNSLHYYTSTNGAFDGADQLAARFPGQEFVVYQEKGSRVVQKKSKAELLHEEIQKDINNSRSYETVSRKTSATLAPCHSHYDADGHLFVRYKVT